MGLLGAVGQTNGLERGQRSGAAIADARYTIRKLDLFNGPVRGSKLNC